VAIELVAVGGESTGTGRRATRRRLGEAARDVPPRLHGRTRHRGVDGAVVGRQTLGDRAQRWTRCRRLHSR